MSITQAKFHDADTVTEHQLTMTFDTPNGTAHHPYTQSLSQVYCATRDMVLKCMTDQQTNTQRGASKAHTNKNM